MYRSYADLHAAALGVSGALRRMGLRRGDLVALALDEAEAFLTSLYGASMAGVLPASLHPPGATRDLGSYCDADGRRAESVGRSRARDEQTRRGAIRPRRGERVRTLESVVSYEELAGQAGLARPAGPARAEDEPALDDLAFVQFTSGATSEPKGVALTHRNLCENVNAINGPHGLATTDADSAVSWLPLHHDMGLVGMALGPLYAVAARRVSPDARVREAAGRVAARHLAAPRDDQLRPELRLRPLRAPGQRRRISRAWTCRRWRVAGCGAEPIHAPTLSAFADRFRAVWFSRDELPARVRPRRTRRGRDVCAARPAASHRRRARQLRRAAARPSSADRRTSEGADLPEREVGEIRLAGPSVMQGYFEHGAVTCPPPVDGWLRTGDLGYLADGELYVCGRVKDLIIANGRKIYPQDLEWGVDELSGIRRGRTVAFGTADAAGRDRLVMIVEPNGTVEAAQLAAGVRRRVADLYGLFVDDVVVAPGGTVGRTSSGKVQRAMTRARYERGEIG